MPASALERFAADVGPVGAGPVVAAGGRTQWDIGGAVRAGTREVRAPVGIVALEPAEMTVRVRVGTTVDDLDAALAPHGQCVALPGGGGTTVGGVLAVGRSGLRRVGYGPVRDTLLEVRYVSADGALVKAGGPTVKNVSGYDLCRLLVGSLGTLGLMGEVVLRTRPLPASSQWFAGETDPFATLAALHHPTAVLWDGETTWVLLEGHPGDIGDESRRIGLPASPGPPALPAHRWSMRPGELAALPGDGLGAFVAQIGVGIAFRHLPPPVRVPDPVIASLHTRLKAQFDPAGRLAPGRDVLAA